jgi:hypothetical protein
VGLHHTQARERLAAIREDEISECSLGLYTKHEIYWHPRLRSTFGRRADGYYFDVASDETRNSGKRVAAILSPKINLGYRVSEYAEFYLNAGTGFHGNDARGTTIRVEPNTEDTPAARVDPLVTSRSVDLGARFSVDGRLVSTVSVWVMDLDSELQRHLAGPGGATRQRTPDALAARHRRSGATRGIHRGGS